MLNFLKRLFHPTPIISPWLETDYHTHLLPGVDDGVQTTEESIAIIGELVRRGAKHIYLTPHCYHPLYPNTLATTKPVFEKFRIEVAKHYPDLKLSLGGECRISLELLEAIERGDELPLFDEDAILIENSLVESSEYVNEIFFQLKSRGYRVVLAHPERYPYLNRKISNYKRLLEEGWLLQVNRSSLSGRYGRKVKELTERLVQKKRAIFKGSDIHGKRHL